jgi:hypothetical protein
VVIGLMIATGATTFRLEPLQFFLGLVFPYILVAGMAWVGARVLSTSSAPRSSARASWGATTWRKSWARVAWAEVWRARHRCWRGPAAIKLIPARAGR